LFLGIILSILAAFCWGSTVIVVKVVLKEQSPLVSIIIRGFSAVCFLLILLLTSGLIYSFKSLFQMNISLLLIIGGVLNSLGEILYFKAIKIGKASIVQVASSITPIFIATILIIGNIEIISILTIIGTITTVIGVGFVSQKNRYNDSKEEINTKLYYTSILLAILGALSWSISLVMLNFVFEFPNIDTYSVTALRFFVSTIFTTIVWLIFSIGSNSNNKIKRERKSISKRNFIFLVYAGIMAWGIGSVAYFEAIRLIGISRASPITAINPLITVILGIIILKENLNRYQILGIIIIITGTIIVSIS